MTTPWTRIILLLVMNKYSAGSGTNPSTIRTTRSPFLDGWITSSASALRRAPIETYLQGWREQGDVVRFRLGGPFDAYLVVHPEGVDHVLREDNQNYGKVEWHNARFRELLGNGLATSEGDRWLSRRRLLQPAFHRERIEGMVAVMVGATEEVAARWDLVQPGDIIDMSREMMGLTLTIATRTLLGIDPAAEAPRMGPFIDESLRHIIRRLESLIAVPLGIPAPANRRFVAARRELDGFILGLIEARRADRSGPSNMLDILLDTRDAETGEPLTTTDLRDEIMTMLMAGHESTSVALTWAWYLLAQHPDVFGALRSEVDAVLDGGVPTLEQLGQLHQTSMIIDETLRLYPPAWSTTRSPLHDDVIGGRRIPKGKIVIVSPYVTHRHPDFWPNPEAFEPERFRDGVPTGDNRFSYFPFGGGPRQCLGLTFALTEAKIILAMLASRFHPALPPGHVARLDPQVTLRPLGGMPMRLG